MSESVEENQVAVGVFPTPHGIGLMIKNGADEVTVVISPDDAGRVIMSLINTSVMVTMNQAARAVQEQSEVADIRRMIEEGKSFDLSKLKK